MYDVSSHINLHSVKAGDVLEIWPERAEFEDVFQTHGFACVLGVEGRGKRRTLLLSPWYTLKEDIQPVQGLRYTIGDEEFELIDEFGAREWFSTGRIKVHEAVGFKQVAHFWTDSLLLAAS